MKKSAQKVDKRAPLSVGEVAARSGVPVSTIHFYEQKGLIQSWRNSGNQRRFPRDVLRRIAVIKVAQHLGFSLSTITEALASLLSDRAITTADWSTLSAYSHEALNARINFSTQSQFEL